MKTLVLLTARKMQTPIFFAVHMWSCALRRCRTLSLGPQARFINYSVYGANTSAARDVLQRSPVVVEFVTKEHAEDMKEIWTPAIAKDFDGSKGRSVLHYSSSEDCPQRFLWVGLGESDKVDVRAIRGAASAAYEKLKSLKLPNASFQLQFDLLGEKIDDGELLQTLANTLEQTNYSFSKHITQEREKLFNLENVDIFIKSRVNVGEYEKSVQRGKLFGDATNFARDLAQERGDVCNPQFLEDVAREIVSKNPEKYEIEVLQHTDLEKLGMNMLLSVGKGAVVPPRLVLLKYNGNPNTSFQDDQNLTALVGKGITFDTGGLNLKPSGSIEEMHLDMGGSAAVLGVADALPKLDIQSNIIIVLCLAENAIGAKSYLPSSILKSYKGLTVEIGNTDAEGRLALGDGLTYVQKHYKPTTVIDLATLTGACVVALGEHCAGLFSNDEALTKAIQDSGTKVFERVWPMPLFPEYTEEVKGTVSDLKNTGKSRHGGACTAAAFLKEFIEPEVKWAHIDIAGTAMTSEKRGHIVKGGTGFGSQLLLQYLLSKE